MATIKSSMDRTVVFGAFALAIVFLTAAVPGYRTLGAKASAQAVITDKLHRWQQSYRALTKATAAWDSSYMPESSVRDLLTLVGLVHIGSYGLSINPDKLTLSRVEAVKHGGVALGLTRVCLATGGGKTLAVSADHYRDLINGVARLAVRPDIEIGSFTIEGDKPAPVAALGDFCILLRGGV